ncbi:MAG: iron-sulfur cluster assembly scaffold protein [Bryobacteraceae bacterium]
MYSEKLLNHFRDPRHAGVLPPPAVMVRVENPGCGDLLELWARVEKGTIQEATFRAQGCPPTVACASALCEWLQERSIPDATGLDACMVEELVGGLPPPSRHAAALAVDAVRKLLEAVKAAAARTEASRAGAF